MPFKKGQKAWNKKDKIQKECLFCNIIFFIKPSIKNRAKFCSNNCKNKYHGQQINGSNNYFFGKKFKKENNSNWSGGNIKVKCNFCNKYFFVIPCRKKSVKYCSRKCMGMMQSLKFKDKKNHPNWKGGITPLYQAIRNHDLYIEWRKEIFNRDNYTCIICNKTGVELNSHHIVKFSKIINDYNITTVNDAINNKELFNLDNGITLCVDCHSDVTGDEINYENFFKQIILC